MDRLTDPHQFPPELLLREVGARLPLRDRLHLAQVNRCTRDAVLADVDERHPVQTSVRQLVDDSFKADAVEGSSAGAKQLRELLYRALCANNAERWIAIWRALLAGGRRRLRAVRPLELFDLYIKRHVKPVASARRRHMRHIQWLARAMCNVYGDPQSTATYIKSVRPRWVSLLHYGVDQLWYAAHPWFRKASHYTMVAQLAGASSLLGVPMSSDQYTHLCTHLLLRSPALHATRSASVPDGELPPLSAGWQRLWRGLERRNGLVVSLYGSLRNGRISVPPNTLAEAIVELVECDTSHHRARPKEARARASILRFLVDQYLDRLRRGHYALLPGFRTALHMFDKLHWHPAVLRRDLTPLRTLLNIVLRRGSQPVAEYVRTHSKLATSLPHTVARLLTPSSPGTTSHAVLRALDCVQPMGDGLAVARALWKYLVDDLGLAPSEEAQRATFFPLLSEAVGLSAEARAWLGSLPAIRNTRSLARRYAENPRDPELLGLMHYFATLVAAEEPGGDEARKSALRIRCLSGEPAWHRLGLTHLTDPADSREEGQSAQLALFRRYLRDRLRDQGTWYPSAPAARHKRTHAEAFDASPQSPEYSPISPSYSHASPRPTKRMRRDTDDGAPPPSPEVTV